MMKFPPGLIAAFFHHVSLIVRLKHDGSGMPKEMPAAMLLSLLFIVFSLINNQSTDGITLDTFIKVGFIAQCYVLFLRNQLIGLIMLISVVSNAIAFALIQFIGLPKAMLNLLLIAEYIMVTAAILNVLKKVTKTI